ncbi:hypothetical protein [Acetobacter pasteurianus]|uniref:Uncharacterized protein n=1 Tax=Acetobacter pasteurianus NBRC 3188 TaxID=1226663 RepID=A0A401WQ10_ACEPA|nr:hypothetical protein [Acetobacter pasteurianus]GCD51411.1 hypothetical protein NBRC3188_0108 [Acetobacter pasteurianus NBRC 3188]
MEKIYSEIRKMDQGDQIELLFRLGRELTRNSCIAGSDERDMFEQFIDRTMYEYDDEYWGY